MGKKQQLLTRLDQIGQSLERSGKGVALIGLGSVGTELDRVDEYSDLDFFVIVAEGYKKPFSENLGWLSEICPIAYCFQNSADGYKLLFADGVFCEFAVFEQPELAQVPFAAGRVVWKRPDVDEAIAIPHSGERPPRVPATTEWLVGEALTNLYVGLGRDRRGEKLSASRFIQGYAVDRIMDLAERIWPEQPAWKDQFSNERRIEQRFPELAKQLPGFVQGYDRNIESAQAILAFFERHFAVNPALAQAIRALCQRGG
jgi:lincosamide nucleotidyltransferase B/F